MFSHKGCGALIHVLAGRRVGAQRLAKALGLQIGIDRVALQVLAVIGRCVGLPHAGERLLKLRAHSGVGVGRLHGGNRTGNSDCKRRRRNK